MFETNEWYAVSFAGEVEGDVVGRCTAIHPIDPDDPEVGAIVRLTFSNDQGTLSFPFPCDDVVSVERTS